MKYVLISTTAGLFLLFFRLGDNLWKCSLYFYVWMVDIFNLLPHLSYNVSNDHPCTLWYVFCDTAALVL